MPPPRGVEEREGSFAAVPGAESGPGCVRRTCEAPQKAREKVLCLISFAVGWGWVIFISVITEAAGRSVSRSTAL